MSVRRHLLAPELWQTLRALAEERCPCSHLKQRHRRPTGELPGEVMGACRDCDCRGLLDWRDDDEEDR